MTGIDPTLAELYLNEGATHHRLPLLSLIRWRLSLASASPAQPFSRSDGCFLLLWRTMGGGRAGHCWHFYFGNEAELLLAGYQTPWVSKSKGRRRKVASSNSTHLHPVLGSIFGCFSWLWKTSWLPSWCVEVLYSKLNLQLGALLFPYPFLSLFPSCPSCSRSFQVVVHFHNDNYCASTQCS